MKPYALLSDLHCHPWTAFSKIGPGGINSRLQKILDEIQRAALELKTRGGETMYLAGDIFHVRGSVDPAVLNPTLDLFEALVESGIKVRAIPGNHDLASKETDRLSNAAEALAKVGVHMVNKRTGVYFPDNNVLVVPWHSSPTELMEHLRTAHKDLSRYHSNMDVIIHAPVNGVIMGIPDHGLDAVALAGLGYKRVFAGHYHNHVDFGNGVYSIGATTHQTWSDPGTKAGFLLVGETVEWRKSHAPAFVDITAETDPAELPLLVDGNYVRVKLEISDESEIAALRQELERMGAAGVTIHPVMKPKEATARTGAVSSGTLESLGSILSKFVASKHPALASTLDPFCQQILNEIEVVA